MPPASRPVAMLVVVLLVLLAGATLPSGAALAAEPRVNADGGEPPFMSLEFERLKKTFPARLAVDLASVGILVLAIYWPHYRKTDYFFTFFMFNVTIFFVTALLSQVNISTGAAFGLFAVFSLLRYRTEDITPKDMTYLFVCIALGLLSAANKGTILEMVLVNGGILLVAFLLDGRILFQPLETKTIQYDSVERTKPEHLPALVADLRERTGLDIRKVTVGRVDFLRDSAVVRIYYRGQPSAD